MALDFNNIFTSIAIRCKKRQNNYFIYFFFCFDNPAVRNSVRFKVLFCVYFFYYIKSFFARNTNYSDSTCAMRCWYCSYCIKLLLNIHTAAYHSSKWKREQTTRLYMCRSLGTENIFCFPKCQAGHFQDAICFFSPTIY